MYEIYISRFKILIKKPVKYFFFDIKDCPFMLFRFKIHFHIHSHIIVILFDIFYAIGVFKCVYIQISDNWKNMI